MMTKGTHRATFSPVKTFAWHAAKNVALKHERGISFEDVIFHLQTGDVIDLLIHPNQMRYPGQMVYVVLIDEYVYLVPLVESDDEIFLKTIIPSRKATKRYTGGRHDPT